jgi:hypothetical protein
MIKDSNFKPLNIKLFILVFVVGATRFFDFTIIVRVPLAEIIVFLSLPFLFKDLNITRVKMLPVLGLFLLWATAVVISDWVNGSPFSFFVRGVMKPVFIFALDVVFYGGFEA